MTLADKRKLSAILFLILSFCYGLGFEISRHYHLPDYSGLIFIILGLPLLFGWYYFDSEIVGFKRPIYLNVLVVGLAIIGLPAYLLMSRGIKKGAPAVGLCLLLFIASYLLSFFGVYTCYWVLHTINQYIS